MIKKDVYYENFSKFLLKSNNRCKHQETYPYSKWISDQKTIHDVPLKVLKTTLKSQKCPITGNKQILITRLHTRYLQIKSAITIQRMFRGFLVRECENLRGPAAKELTICTNETEFETMNPLADIPKKDLFSYRDERGFVYGFNMFALLRMLENDNGKLVNPYNREDIPFNAVNDLFRLYVKRKIIYDSPHI